MNKRRNKLGFTLAELLIVVAIIGVLVAIAIPVFTSSLEKAREAVCMSNRRSLLSMVTHTAMLNEDFLKEAKSYTWNEVKEALANEGESFTDDICPSNGKITVSRPDAKVGFIVYCEEHEKAVDENTRTDWLSGEQAATDILTRLSSSFLPSQSEQNDDYRFFKEYSTLTGGKLQTADIDDVLTKFPAGSKLNVSKNDNGVAWTGVRVFFDNEPHDILVLATGKDAASTAETPPLKGFLFYYNGKYYRSNNSDNNTYKTSGLYGGQNNKKLSFDEFLSQKHWVACE